jgi:YbbR domain-containing protein
MLKRLTNNFGLKLLAFVFAVAAWLIVVNVEDPDITKTFTVNVETQNENLLTEAGKTYEIENSSDTIRVTATAKRSIMEQLSASDFQAVVDFKDIASSDVSGQQNLRVYVSALRYNSQVSINSTEQYVTVSVDDMVEKAINVDVIPTGSPAIGHATGTISGYPTVVTVQGPATIVNSIAQALVEIDIDGMTEDINQEENISFVNENGESVNTDRLTIDRTTANVYVQCLSLQSVNLEFQTQGTPEDGYEVSNISADKTTIMIKGTADQLSSVTSLTISGDAMDVDGASEDKEVTVDLKNYLPEGVSLQNEDDSTVKINIKIDQYQKKDLTIQTNKITTSGLDSSYKAEFKDSQISFSVYCSGNSANQLSTDSIQVSADLSNYKVGTYEVKLNISLPDGVELENDVTTDVVIKAK